MTEILIPHIQGVDVPRIANSAMGLMQMQQQMLASQQQQEWQKQQHVQKLQEINLATNTRDLLGLTMNGDTEAEKQLMALNPQVGQDWQLFKMKQSESQSLLAKNTAQATKYEREANALLPGTQEHKASISRSRAGATHVVNNNVPEGYKPLAKATNDLHGEILRTTMDLSIYDDIGSIIKPEHFQHLDTAVAGNLLPELERWGVTLTPAQAGKVSQKTALEMLVGQLFDRYRKNITGAAAAEQEITRLEKNFVNMGQSWTQFQQGLTTLRELDQKRARIAREVLRTGDITAGSEDFNRSVSQLWGTGGRTMLFINNRKQDLMDEGLSPVETRQRLFQEGYITQPMVRALEAGNRQLFEQLLKKAK